MVLDDCWDARIAEIQQVTRLGARTAIPRNGNGTYVAASRAVLLRAVD
jgi:hypothetical protein